MDKKDRIWEIIEYVLGLAALISLFIFIHLRMSSELYDPDIWLHLKSGEYIVEHKAIPHTDLFSATASGKEWIDHSWLVQVIFYLVFHFGGADNLIFLSALLVTTAFIFLFFSVYNQRKALTLCVAILAIAIFASKVRFNIRPENFSILFFSIYLFLLAKYIRKKSLFILVFVQLLWVNCHGFFMLGPLLLGIFILGERLKKMRALPWRWSAIEPLEEQSYKNLLTVFLFTCIVSLFNPYGYKGALYPLKVIFNSAGQSNILYNNIQELLPTWRLDPNMVAPYYALAIISLAVFLLNFRRTNIAHLMLWLIFFGISVRVNRNVLFFNFIAYFSAVSSLSQGLEIKKLDFMLEPLKRLVYILKYGFLAIIIILVGQRSYLILSTQYYILEENRMKSALLGTVARGYPDKAADFILKNKLPGNLFNIFNCGSYLVYRLYPKLKVFIDGRTELYAGEFFSDYLKVLGADKPTIDNLFARYNINTLLLSGNDASFVYLSRFFFNQPDWALVYFDEETVIFLKDTLLNKPLIDKLKLNLEKWETKKADLNKIGIRKIWPEPYIKRAWMLYYLNLDAQALREAAEALRILPSAADAYSIMGRIYTKQKMYAQAYEKLRLAGIYAPGNPETLIGLGNLYTAESKFKKALEFYRDLVKVDPSSAESYYLLGQGYHNLNNRKLAIESIQRAIQLSPYSAKYYQELGYIFCQEGNPQKAIQAYQDAINAGLDPGHFNKLILNPCVKSETKN